MYDWKKYEREREEKQSRVLTTIEDKMIYIKEIFVEDLVWHVDFGTYNSVSVSRKLSSLSFVHAATVDDFYHWNRDQCAMQVLACLGLSGLFHMEKAMPLVSSSKEEKYNAGREAAEALVPFLNMRVPLRSINTLARLVAQWCGYEDNASFTDGFNEYCWNYMETNGLIKNNKVITSTRLEGEME